MSATKTTTRNKHFGGDSSAINTNNTYKNNDNLTSAAGLGCGSGSPYKRSTAAPSFDITKEELSRISEALKKEEFRKLFLDYCEEIQDPENRKRYEDEIKQLEAERGVDVRFINPEPGFVIKTSADGQLKCFINVAQCDEVAKPTNEVSLNHESGQRGISWSLPMAQAPPRDDLDAHNKRCRVYDVVFHPDALHLAKRNNEFRKCLIDTALDAVEREFKVKLDRANLKFPKLDYKGVARPTVIRKLAKNPPPETTEPHPLENIYPARPTADAGEPKLIPAKAKIPPKPEFATPKYVIKHRRDIDLTEYTGELDAKLNLTLPRELVVEIELPLLPTAADCQLDVTERSVYLFSERAGAKYRVKIELPYMVKDKEGTARFDTDTRKLSITLPVIQPSLECQRNMHNSILHLSREDSGVDSDMREESTSDGSSSPSASPVQELEQSFEDCHESSLEDEENKAIESVDKNEAKLEEVTTAETTEPELKLMPEATSETFLNASVPYKFPEKFDCNTLDETMSFVLHVRNVQPMSIIKLQMERGVHLHFTSIGSGYYPHHYAFYMQLPAEYDVEIVSSDAEAWENNVVLNVQLSGPSENMETYLAGIDSKNISSYNVRNRCKAFVKKAADGARHSPGFDIQVARPQVEIGDAIEIEIKPREPKPETKSTEKVVDDVDEAPVNTTTTEDEETIKAGGDAQRTAAAAAQKKLTRKQRKRQKKQRSLSESACDDIKNAIEKMEAQQQIQNQSPKTSKTSIMTQTLSSSLLSNGDGKASNPIPTTPTTAQTPRKQRSYSECRDHFAGRGENGNACALSLPFKGILKHHSRYGVAACIGDSSSNSHLQQHPLHQHHHHHSHQARYLTSDSCSSSVEDCSSYASSIDSGAIPATSAVHGNASFSTMHFSKSFSDIPEENVSICSGLSESCKKTVRFNDIIQKQTFKLDSSILGQRKKNQKRRDRKQRALQRRHSEGDSADYEEDHKPIVLKSKTTALKSETDTNTSGDDNVEVFKQPPNNNDLMKNDKQQQNHNINNQNTNNCDEINKNNSTSKSHKGKKKRHQPTTVAAYIRHESESSDVDGSKGAMMFEIDLE